MSIERRHIQAIGAALSRRDWQSMEAAYNTLRDEFDRHETMMHHADEAWKNRALKPDTGEQP